MEFVYKEMFPMGKDTTEYHLLTKEYVSVEKFGDKGYSYRIADFSDDYSTFDIELWEIGWGGTVDNGWYGEESCVGTYTVDVVWAEIDPEVEAFIESKMANFPDEKEYFEVNELQAKIEEIVKAYCDSLNGNIVVDLVKGDENKKIEEYNLNNLKYHGFIGFLKGFVPSGTPGWLIPLIFPLEVVSLIIKVCVLAIRVCH